MGYKHLTQVQIEEIVQIFQETKSTRIAADRLGISIQRVQYHLKRLGIPLTGFRETACYANFEDVVRWACDGVSYSEIARRVGTNHHRVKDFLDRYDIDHPGHKQTGANNPNWRGGRRIDKDGAILILSPEHPRKDRHGYVREHRLVMEKRLGRYLAADEVVHHIDGNNQNNATENLKLFPTNAAHLAETLKGKTPNWTPKGRQRTLEAVRRPRDQKRRPNHDSS